MYNFKLFLKNDVNKDKHSHLVRRNERVFYFLILTKLIKIIKKFQIEGRCTIGMVARILDTTDLSH